MSFSIIRNMNLIYCIWKNAMRFETLWIGIQVSTYNMTTYLDIVSDLDLS